ncbi:hypothetical protein STAQ_22370 [Allostella sp. ATCC 35155]|nr:hypothetical protein STAQ_22370 [Stella sp. ATCC 35155]
MLIDVDGVLVAGGLALPGAGEFLRALRGRDFIVSNNSTDTPKTMAEKFLRQGLPVEPRRVSLAGAVMVETIAAEAPDEATFLIAAPSLAAYAEARGMRLTDEEPAPILALARDTGLSYERLHRAARVLHGGARWFVANPDRTHPDADGGPVPETGALMSALAACVPEARPRIIGKPEPGIFLAALAKAGVGPGEAVMIGDNPETDGMGADALGIPKIMVGPRGTVGGVADLLPCL